MLFCDASFVCFFCYLASRLLEVGMVISCCGEWSLHFAGCPFVGGGGGVRLMCGVASCVDAAGLLA